jgi:hypothetical protein
VLQAILFQLLFIVPLATKQETDRQEIVSHTL